MPKRSRPGSPSAMSADPMLPALISMLASRTPSMQFAADPRHSIDQSSALRRRRMWCAGLDKMVRQERKQHHVVGLEALAMPVQRDFLQINLCESHTLSGVRLMPAQRNREQQ
jgi:hypothetical protein